MLSIDFEKPRRILPAACPAFSPPPRPLCRPPPVSRVFCEEIPAAEDTGGEMPAFCASRGGSCGRYIINMILRNRGGSRRGRYIINEFLRHPPRLFAPLSVLAPSAYLQITPRPSPRLLCGNARGLCRFVCFWRRIPASFPASFRKLRRGLLCALCVRQHRERRRKRGKNP